MQIDSIDDLRPCEKNSSSLAGPALRTFFRIADAWALNELEQAGLLGLGREAIPEGWRAGDVADLSENTLDRISCVFGMYSGLQVLLPKSADQWVRKPNTATLFGGASALEFMLAGDVTSLHAVRTYVQSQCDN